MKTKYTEDGRKYLISPDEFLEGLSLSIIFNLHKVENPEAITLKDKLWEAAYIYLDDAPTNSAIFTHTMIGFDNKDEMVYFWIKEAITAILSHIPFKEKKVKLAWGKPYKTDKSLLVRETTDGKYIALKFFTNGIVMNKKDYTILLEDLGVELNDITPSQFNRLEYAIRSSIGDHSYFTRYKSLRCFYESVLTEKGITSTQTKREVKYDINRGLVQENYFDLELDKNIFIDI